MSNTSLSTFWKNFVEQHWQKKPLLFKKPFVSELANETEFFRGLIEASRRFRLEKIKLPFEFFNHEGSEFEGEQLETFLPSTSETTLSQYAERVTDKPDGQKFALIINGLFFVHQPALWLKARSFLYDFFNSYLINHGVRLYFRATMTKHLSVFIVTQYDGVEFNIKPEGLRTLREKLLSLRAIEIRKTEIPQQAIINNALIQNHLATAVV